MLINILLFYDLTNYKNNIISVYLYDKYFSNYNYYSMVWPIIKIIKEYHQYIFQYITTLNEQKPLQLFLYVWNDSDPYPTPTLSGPRHLHHTNNYVIRVSSPSKSVPTFLHIAITGLGSPTKTTSFFFNTILCHLKTENAIFSLWKKKKKEPGRSKDSFSFHFWFEENFFLKKIKRWVWFWWNHRRPRGASEQFNLTWFPPPPIIRPGSSTAIPRPVNSIKASLFLIWIC